MTREEAIVDIRENIKPVVGGKSLDMAIKALPSVSPQQRTGHWIYHYGHIPYKNECSECGKRFGTDTNYCPNCGCKMEVEE